MGERMFKTLITHYILETCIDILMENIKNNFSKPSRMSRMEIFLDAIRDHMRFLSDSRASIRVGSSILYDDKLYTNSLKKWENECTKLS